MYSYTISISKREQAAEVSRAQVYKKYMRTAKPMDNELTQRKRIGIKNLQKIVYAMRDSPLSKPLAFWLFSCAFMVFVMILLGAITRLTESGLSIAEWKPLIGALPPLNQTAWEKVFALYQQTPEFQKKNFWMTLPDFKVIFFWEWFHRLWGRLIGLVFALPLFIFWWRKMLPKGALLKFSGLLILGGAQGFMGWYMVKSGLVDIPAVSHFRLAAHLSLAVLIYGLLLYTGLGFACKSRHPDARLHIHSWIALAFVSLTILWGAFTAGLDAGLVYNDSFPLMGGGWRPPDFWKYGSFWQNIMHNHSAVQWAHRWLALSSTLVVLSLWLHGLLRKGRFPALHLMGGMALCQVALGIGTLLSGIFLPLAVIHQAGAVILLGLMILVLFHTKRTAG